LSAPFFANAGILVVDDEQTVVRFLCRALQERGYSGVQGFADATAAAAYLDEATPDLIVVDLGIPGTNGHTLLEELGRRLSGDASFTALAIGEMEGTAARLRAWQAGATSFLAKPIDIDELLMHVQFLLETCFTNRRLAEARGLLQELVQSHSQELRQAHLEVLDRLAKVAEIRDDTTGQHPNRVGRLSALIAQELHVSSEEVELIMRAAPLHDLGNVAMADCLLLKSGSFSTEERDLMREHALLGAELLHGSNSDVLQMAELVARSHHERWDGHGYPHRLAGEDIPLPGRIVAVADAFDALTHWRPYREAWSVSAALAEIEHESGWQFDPAVVDALVRVQQRERGLESPEAGSRDPSERGAKLEARSSESPLGRQASVF
jgi:putative two-component system response regulator